MSKTFQETAIILNSLIFKEKDKILTLFTKEQGIVKVFVKGKQFFNHLLTEKFTVGDFLYTAGKGDLYQFCDGTIVEHYPHLRLTLDALQMGQQLAEAIMRSQWPGKAAPALFDLFLAFLKKIPATGLYAPFLLKILKHEGVLQLERACSSCGSSGTTLRFGGMRFCKHHAPHLSVAFDELEEEHLVRLFGARSFDSLLVLPPTDRFVSKVQTLFMQSFES